MKTKKMVKYLICANQRVGSTLLCSLLFNTHMFSKGPYEYEILENRKGELERIDWGKEDLKEFFEKIFESKLTLYNTAGFKIMWTQIENLVRELNKTDKYKDVSVWDLPSFLPSDLKYVWLKRRDKVQQAVSYLKARQTRIWMLKKGEEKNPIEYPVFDSEKIHSDIEECQRRELAWKRFFKKNKIRPLELEYEDFIKDFRGTILKIFEYLEISIPKDLVIKTNFVKQGDALSEEWVKRYYDEMTFKKKAMRFYSCKVKVLRKVIDPNYLMRPIYNFSFRLKERFPSYKRFIERVKKQGKMNTEKKIRYLICANSRTGSTLLGNMLFNTGLFPGAEEIFDPKRIDVKKINWEEEDLREFFEGIFESVKIPNSVSGFKMMWPQIEKLVRVINKTDRYRGVSVGDIPSFLPSDLKYVWVKRKDKVRQGVSLLKAKQTETYYIREGEHKKLESNLVFDFKNLDFLIDDCKHREIAWGEFFRRNKIRPLVLEYEDFIKDFRGTVVKVLDYLGIPVPENLVVKTSLVKQSDALSEEWVKRYYDEMTFKKKAMRFYSCKVKVLRKVIDPNYLMRPIYKFSYLFKKRFPSYEWFIEMVKNRIK